MTSVLRHLRRNVVAYVALLVALGAGGGYAVAATTGKTITVCADKRTGVLHLHNRGRCARSQTRVRWNQQGTRGPQGAAGPAGQPGAPAATAWAVVTDPGTVLAGHGISAQHVSAGDYQLTITDAKCAQSFNAPVVTVSDGNPPAGQSAGAFPIAWVAR